MIHIDSQQYFPRWLPFPGKGGVRNPHESRRGLMMRLRRSPHTPEEIRERNIQRNRERILNPPKASFRDQVMRVVSLAEEWWDRHVRYRELMRLLDGARLVREPHPLTYEPLERIRTEVMGPGDKEPEDSFKARRCDEWIDTPQKVLDLAEDVPGAKWMGLNRQARCVLEEHGHETDHWACILNLAPPSDDAIWTHWVDGALPDEVVVLKDCPVYSEENYQGCVGFSGHLGCHGFDLYDAERLW